ncbi:Hypothetical predicted protein [Pelobates cultripes]|uniref:Sperm acrosome-associated protein 9 n=1 Tax=Pelobates cultripes TaxID=61616 RepID=A0AAD1T0M9_PELCU|nr:Hypothetical predicted protein [Pelobates cultripes]
MNDVKENLKFLQQRCKLLKQQQVTFITALERCRENAHDRIKPVQNLEQVQNYLDTYCNNSTDRRILTLFLSICSEIQEFCIQLNELQFETRGIKTNLEENFNLLNPANDLSGLKAKYPHDVINHLSCDEAKNFYGGIVSLLPIVMDNIQEAIAKMEKLHSLALHQRGNESSDFTGDQDPMQTTGMQTRVSHRDNKKESLKPAWKPGGSFTC